MQTLYQVLAIAAAGFIIWFLYRSIKGNPEAFSKENFSKSTYTMGLLALGLIAFVALCVWFLRVG
jgi:hypothetical protein